VVGLSYLQLSSFSAHLGDQSFINISVLLFTFDCIFCIDSRMLTKISEHNYYDILCYSVLNIYNVITKNIINAISA
jgi:hypothetical protein